ncbi:lytic transglycosylase domain-containing protein [Cobetia crustatorum]|uniref:Lytic transglycosylase domain-containing protein n=1 Tax=Cobetia crustatorum TaxID=553385 RepID=A0A558HXN0_9GAMM|nr:transglycosylase SLT domain-containing protein [Cobetia crustatorum]TVU73844.1 lytic transglycosylase domain-containing protein [Cobetia crustatorum]
MADTISELLIGLKLDVDAQSFRNANSAFNGVRDAGLRMGRALGAGGVAAGLTQLGTSYAATTAEIARFARESGTSAQFVSGLEFAFKQAGGSAGDARASISNFMKMYEDFEMGRHDKFNAATAFGFDTGSLLKSEDFGAMISNISSQVSKASPALRKSMLEALGIDGIGARSLLGSGPAQIEAYMKTAQELAPVTSEMADASIDATQALGEMSLAMKGFSDQMSMGILPDLTSAMREITGMMAYVREASGDESSPLYWLKQAWDAPNDAIDWIGDKRQGIIDGGGLGAWWDQVVEDGNERRNDDFGKGIYKPSASLDPNDPIGDNILGALAMQESGGKHRDANGNLTRSHAGALGAYQIKPSTGAVPGYGIAPLKSNSEADQKAFADDYLTKMLKRYGNLDQALASYNAGAGAVDKAIKTRGDNWLSALPPETRDYVPSVKAKMSEQGGRPVSISGGLNVTVSGATDPEAVGREVTRQIGVMAQQAGSDYSERGAV